MPAPIFITVNRSYQIDYISGEVEQLINDIINIRSQLSSLDSQKASLVTDLRDKQNQLLQLYVSQSGQLPS